MSCGCNHLDRILDRLDTIERLQSVTLSRVERLERMTMSWQDSFTKFSGDVDACFARVTQHLTDLQGQIDTLKSQLANTDIPADAQATLDAIDQKVNAFDVTPPTPPVTPDQPTPPATPDQPAQPTG